MPTLTEINLTGLAAVPDGAQENAVVTVRKEARSPMDKAKVQESLMDAGASAEVAKAVSEALTADEPDGGAVAKALKPVFEATAKAAEPAPAEDPGEYVGTFEDGTVVTTKDSKPMQAAVVELAKMRREKARQPFPFLAKVASAVLDAGLDAETRAKAVDGKNPVVEQLKALETRIAKVAMPSAESMVVIDGFDKGDVATKSYDVDYKAAVKEYAEANGIEDDGEALKRFGGTEKAAELRREIYGE